jgi:hypothetical protein
MLVACRVAGLSALEAHYAGLVALTQSGAWGGVHPSPIFAPSNGARSYARGWRGKAAYWSVRAGCPGQLLPS